MAERNFENRTLFKGENLDFLRGMNSQTVDLIATDPPFNKGKDFHATPESLSAGARFQDRWRWKEDVQTEWVDAIKDDQPRVYSLINHVVGGIDNDPKTRKRLGGREDLAAFLCFMGVRLIEMRRVLKDTGSLYLHCDPTASHYLKALMDAIFGDKNFRNEIVWHYGKWSNAARYFQRNHDLILFYSKNSDYAFYKQFSVSDDMRRKLAIGYQVNRPSGVKQLIVYDRAKAADKIAEGNYDAVVYRDDENPGALLHDTWCDINIINSQSRERMGYPTQKPLALYERIIKASSNEGDLVLDPFCGCATTPIAAERLGRQWVGMDLWDGAYAIINQRIEENKQLLADGNVKIILRDIKDPPIRADGGEDAPTFELRLQRQRPVERWQKLSHEEMRKILIDAQSSATGLVDCAGCGRSLEPEFMELDHINPRAQGGENYITNRILLCGPCNRRKSASLTIIGLQQENKREGWMRDQRLANSALVRANKRAQEVTLEMLE